ncbi:MAG: helix-turn-helix transcriptional regulator [Pseudomonadota bacterium]
MQNMNDEFLGALKRVLGELQGDEAAPVPATALAGLMDLAQRDVDLTIDMTASRALGAPLITVRHTGAPEVLAALSPRQKQVAKLMIAGKSNKAIARDLGLSVATVKDHAHAILKKCSVATRRELMALALVPPR